MDDQIEASEPVETLQESAAPVEDSSPDPFESGADTFDRAYVERLRKENATYRTRAKEYEDYAKHFEPYGEEDRAVWTEAMRLFNEDPQQGADYLERIAQAVKAGFTQEQAEAIAADGSDEPLTRADLDRIFAEREAKAAEDAAIARIEKQAVELGYDPASEEYAYLLHVASRLPDGDLNKAHAKIQAAEEARFEARLAKMQAEAEDSPVAPSAGAGAAPSGERQLKTWADADAAFRARLEASRRSS